MAGCSATEIETGKYGLEIFEDGSVIEITDGATIEIIEECGAIVELATPTVSVEINQPSVTELELIESTVGIEVLQQLVINNPDPLPPAESAQRVSNTYELGESVSINRVVYVMNDGRIAHADKDAAIDHNDIIGISENNGATGQFIKVTEFGVKTGDLGGGESATYWLGSDGQVVTTAPLTGTIIHVATQLAGNKIRVNIGQPLKRE